MEAEKERKRADRYDLAEVFLEIGLVVTSITLLSWAPKVLARGN